MSPASGRRPSRAASVSVGVRLASACTAAVAALLIAAVSGAPAAQARAAAGTLRFAVIGDHGTGDSQQYDIGERLAAAHAAEPVELVLMLGDNMYGREEPGDFEQKFTRPFGALLRARVPFYGALGNHDDPESRFFPGFNMGGRRYYTFVKKHVRFVVLDTNMMDDEQLAWFERTLASAREPWTICSFHHPIYSSGARHGPDVELRTLLEPLMVRFGVQAAFSGHEHVYERLKPQRGIAYFIEGASGKLRKGGVRVSKDTAAFFDQDRSFMLVEIAADLLTFRTISRTGDVVDRGTVRRRPTT